MCGLVTKLWTSEIGPLSAFEKETTYCLNIKKCCLSLFRTFFVSAHCCQQIRIMCTIYIIQGDYLNCPLSTKMMKRQRVNQRLFQMKVFMEHQLWLAKSHTHFRYWVGQ